MISKISKNRDQRTLIELLKGGSVSFALRITGMISGYCLTLIITNGFGAKAMGIYALCLTLITIAGELGKMGLDTAFMRHVTENKVIHNWNAINLYYKKAVLIIAIATMILSICIFVFSKQIAFEIFNKEILGPYFAIACIAIMPWSLRLLYAGGLRGFKKIGASTFLQQVLINLLACFFLLLFLKISGERNENPVFAVVSASFVAFFISHWFWKYHTAQIKTLKKGTGTRSSVKYLSILSISVPMMLTNALFMVILWSDTLMIGILSSEEKVGIYSVAVKIAALIGVGRMAFNSIAAPKFSECYIEDDWKSFQNVVAKNSKLIFLFSFPATCLIVSIPDVLLNFFGQEFSAGVVPLILLAIGQMIVAGSGSVDFILQMTGNEKSCMLLIFIASIINIAGNFFLIPILGLTGAAISSIMAALTWNVLAIIIIYRKLGIISFYIPFYRYPLLRIKRSEF